MTLKVIGAGLGRTGTSSLKVALEEHLGFERCYHMAEVSPANMPLWVAAANGQPEWDRIFDGFASTTDYPACHFWRELADFYPDAKVLLSVRDPNKWFDSTQATIFTPEMTDHLRNSPAREFFEKCVWDGILDRINDRAFMVDHFNRHIERVKRAIPARRLLVYDVKEGWEPLCRFLGVAVPAVPFPRTNDTEHAQTGIRVQREVHMKLQELVPKTGDDEMSAFMHSASELYRANSALSSDEIVERILKSKNRIA